MAEQLIKALVLMTLTGSAVFALLTLLSPLTRRVTNAGFRYYGRAAAMLFFVIPFSCFSLSLISPVTDTVAAANPAPTQKTAAAVAKAAPVAATMDNYVFKNANVSVAPQSAAKAAAPVFPLSLPACLLCVWALGVLGVLGGKAVRGARFARLLRLHCRPVEYDEAAARIFDREKAAVGLHRPVELLCSTSPGSPFACGLLHARVVLPESLLTAPPNELRYIFRHELTHIRRFDLPLKLLAQFVAALHWFNPLMLLITRELDRCCELSCDACVVKVLPQEERRLYGDAILSSLAAAPAARGLCAAMGSSGRSLKQRLSHIAGFRKTGKRALFAGVLLTVFVAGSGILSACSVFSTGGSTQPKTFRTIKEAVNYYASHIEAFVKKDSKTIRYKPKGSHRYYSYSLYEVSDLSLCYAGGLPSFKGCTKWQLAKKICSRINQDEDKLVTALRSAKSSKAIEKAEKALSARTYDLGGNIRGPLLKGKTRAMNEIFLETALIGELGFSGEFSYGTKKVAGTELTLMAKKPAFKIYLTKTGEIKKFKVTSALEKRIRNGYNPYAS